MHHNSKSARIRQGHGGPGLVHRCLHSCKVSLFDEALSSPTLNQDTCKSMTHSFSGHCWMCACLRTETKRRPRNHKQHFNSWQLSRWAVLDLMNMSSKTHCTRWSPECFILLVSRGFQDIVTISHCGGPSRCLVKRNSSFSITWLNQSSGQVTFKCFGLQCLLLLTARRFKQNNTAR